MLEGRLRRAEENKTNKIFGVFMCKLKSICFFCLPLSIIILFVGCMSVTNNIKVNESSQVIKETFTSKSLNKEMKFNIYLPKGYNNRIKYPVLYLLHGYTDNEDKWMPILNLQEVVDNLIINNKITPLIIVMPQIDNSFGLNSDKSINISNIYTAGLYEDYLYKDLITYIDKKYSTIKNKNSRFIGGLSMGGFAALHLAFIHPDLFSKVGGHSPALLNESWLYPTDQIRNERDPIKLATKKNIKSLKVYLDCGDKDSFKFFTGCAQLYKVLQENNVASEYHFNNGEHNDAYWKENSEKYLLFYAGK
jgi:enterochelin esterase-like enzyme